MTLAPIFDLAQIGTDVRGHTVGAARDESRGQGPAYNWNGFYAGGQMGVGVLRSRVFAARAPKHVLLG